MSWMLASSDEFISVTPSDSILLTYPTDQNDLITRKCKAIYVGVAGDVAVKNSAGTTITYTNLTAGVIHPISTNLILLTGTTATGIIAIF